MLASYMAVSNIKHCF